MIYVGIGIAKLNHFAPVLPSEVKVLVGPFEFTNDGDGFQYLISVFEPFDDSEIIIGLESTATTLFSGHPYTYSPFPDRIDR